MKNKEVVLKILLVIILSIAFVILSFTCFKKQKSNLNIVKQKNTTTVSKNKITSKENTNDENKNISTTTDSNKKNTTNKETKTSDKKDEENKDSNKKHTIKSSTSTTVTQTVKATSNMHQINQNLINEIHNTYGYWIGYGNGDYCYYDYCNPATDENKVNEALNIIKNASSRFPSGFFRIFQGVNGYRVYLYDSIPYNASGVASYPYGDNVLSLNISHYDDSVYYHETFHIMEQYILYKGGSFNSWNNYNPDKYEYGNAYETYYDNYNSNAYFLMEYSRTNEREDRAVLFSDLMMRSGVCYYNTYKDYMSPNTPLNNKMKYMVSVINTYIPNNNARWNWCVRY